TTKRASHLVESSYFTHPTPAAPGTRPFPFHPPAPRRHSTHPTRGPAKTAVCPVGRALFPGLTDIRERWETCRREPARAIAPASERRNRLDGITLSQWHPQFGPFPVPPFHESKRSGSLIECRSQSPAAFDRRRSRSCSP